MTKRALDCPDILYAIGEWIPAFQLMGHGEHSFHTFKPQTLLVCRLVSKLWCKILTPLLWRVDDTGTMSWVPQALLEKYSEHVRAYNGLSNKWYARTYLPPPMHSQLRQLEMGKAVQSGEVASRMVSMNSRLWKLRMNGIIPFYQRKKVASTGNVGATNNFEHQERDGDDFDENSHSFTNPLGHLRATLQELVVEQLRLEPNYLFYLLRAVARGNLQTLKLDNISGSSESFDLQDIVFMSLTRLDLYLDNRSQPGLYGLHEIVGRSPFLEHLELNGERDQHCLDPLVHTLHGTLPDDEALRQRFNQLRTGGRWSRPHLKTLRLRQQLHRRQLQENAKDQGNDPKLLDLVRSAGATYNACRELMRPSTLRVLEVSLWFLDDLARSAIETTKSTLEELIIVIIPDREGLPTWKHERQGIFLRKILVSCSRLKTLRFWDQNGDEDISTIMRDIIGERGVGGHDLRSDHREDDDNNKAPKVKLLLDCPALESLVLRSIRTNFDLIQTEPEKERVFINDHDDSHSTAANSSVPWIMPQQCWDPRLQDGTDILLDVRWNSFELFEDVVMENGSQQQVDTLLERFLRHISPSRKLKSLQLGQLKFTRAV